MIEIDGEPDEIVSIRINGESLHSDDGETWYLPKGLIGDVPVNQLPDTAVFEICDHIEDSIIMMNTIPIRVQRIGDNRVRLEFEDSESRKYWDGTIGFKAYMETKKGIVEERTVQVGDITLTGYEDDGAWIHLGVRGRGRSRKDLHGRRTSRTNHRGDRGCNGNAARSRTLGSERRRTARRNSLYVRYFRFFGSLASKM